MRKLAGLIRQLTARGAGVVYVSHRLPEILELAQRVTILRDGVHQGVFPVTAEVSEHDLVVADGRARHRQRIRRTSRAAAARRVVLSARGLSGEHFTDVSFDAYAGEILGFAGAEGNGQREALRALGGLEEAHGAVLRNGAAIDASSPKAALANGVIFLSADRSGEAVFPELGVRKNMTLARLGDFLAPGLRLRRARARRRAAHEVGLHRRHRQPRQADRRAVGRQSAEGGAGAQLSRGRQGGADRRADAGRRRRARGSTSTRRSEKTSASDGVCIVNSSDAQELAGICERVLVFSRGRVVRELSGDDVNEEKIVSSFLTARDAKTTRAQEDDDGRCRA